MSCFYIMIKQCYFKDFNLYNSNPIYSFSDIKIFSWIYNDTVFLVDLDIFCRYNGLVTFTNALSCILDVSDIEYCTKILLKSGLISDVTAILEYILGYANSNSKYKYKNDYCFSSSNFYHLNYLPHTDFDKEDNKEISIYTNCNIIINSYSQNSNYYDKNHYSIKYCNDLKLYIVEYYCTSKNIWERYIIFKNELKTWSNITGFDNIVQEHSEIIDKVDLINNLDNFLIPELQNICLDYLTSKIEIIV